MGQNYNSRSECQPVAKRYLDGIAKGSVVSFRNLIIVGERRSIAWFSRQFARRLHGFFAKTVAVNSVIMVDSPTFASRIFRD